MPNQNASFLYSLSRDQLGRKGETAHSTTNCSVHIPLLKLLVHFQHLGSLIRLDSVPGGRVLLGPDNYDDKSETRRRERRVANLLLGPVAKRPIYQLAPTTTPPIMT